MKISKEVKVGFVALFAIALSIWGFNYLKGNNLFVESKSVYAVYPKVPGLAISSPIIINGVRCGIVDDIYFHPDKSSRVVVKLNITESAIKISKNSIADLISTDFMGGKAIGLKLGDSEAELENGDTIQSHFEKSMLEDFSEQMLPIKDKAENMMISLDTAVIKLTTTLENLNEMFIIGQVLYNFGIVLVIIAGLVLLLALVGSVILSLDFKKLRLNNAVFRRLSRTSNFVSFFK